MKSFIKLGPCSTRAMFKKSPCGNIKKVRSLWESELPENMGTLRKGVIGGFGRPRRLLEPRLRDTKELFGCLEAQHIRYRDPRNSCCKNTF